MRNKIALLAVFAAFVLWAVGVGAAQQPAQQNQNVQITQGPRVESTTADSAVIAWSTNVNASTVLKYGTDRNNLNMTAEAPWGGLTHRVTIKNLQPNTTYYFDVESGQGQGTGTKAISGVSQFKTQNGPAGASNQPSASPTQLSSVVGGPIVQKVTDRSVHLWWETNAPLNGSVLKYGTSPSALNQTAQVIDQNNGVTHDADVSNLQPNTEYYFRITRTNGELLKPGTFKTEPANYAQSRPVVITDGPAIQSISPTSVQIAWQTSAPASSIVHYGTNANALNQTAEAPWGSGVHRVTVNNLQPNTVYYFRVESGQAQGTGTAARSIIFPLETMPAGHSAMNIPFQQQ